MNGIEMMMKSFGLDPDKIKAILEAAKGQAEAKLAEVQGKLELIDQRVDACYAQLEDVNNKLTALLTWHIVAEENENIRSN